MDRGCPLARPGWQCASAWSAWRGWWRERARWRGQGPLFPDSLGVYEIFPQRLHLAPSTQHPAPAQSCNALQMFPASFPPRRGSRGAAPASAVSSWPEPISQMGAGSFAPSVSPSSPASIFRPSSPREGYGVLGDLFSPASQRSPKPTTGFVSEGIIFLGPSSALSVPIRLHSPLPWSFGTLPARSEY